MSSRRRKYSIVLRQDRIFRFPVLPEKVVIANGSSNEGVKICGIGEVTVIEASSPIMIQFASFFPRKYFSGCNYKRLPRPKSAVNTILEMKESKKPVRLTITGGMGVSKFFTIESFETYEQGGDPGTIYFDIKLKEYREVVMRKIVVNTKKEAEVAPPQARVDNTKPPRTYTVIRGDCLWKIAQKFYGKGSLFPKIHEANKAIIGGNPNIIIPGQVLTIPE